MKRDYDGLCPWCGEWWESVKKYHYLGCPNPRPYEKLSPDAQKLHQFNELMFGGKTQKKQKDPTVENWLHGYHQLFVEEA